MNGLYLVYFLLGMLLCFGAKLCPRGVWNEEYTSRDQTKVLTGVMTVGVLMHHLSQKTSAPWVPSHVRVTGLEFFVNIGFPAVAVFLFCSGLGLYRSLHVKPDYLKGFFRRRVLRIIVAFYLSEWIYTAVRLLLGERMNLPKILWYLSGLHMANTYSWYVIVIPFFYMAFWAAFRFCKREGTAIFWVFVFTLAYTVLGTLIDHQNTWWMRGEWWYNSIILFPLGLLFGKYEKQVTRFFRRGYWIWLLVSAAAVVLLYLQSDWLINRRWGYYWEGSRMRVPYRLYSAGSQWLVCVAFVAFCFLLMMKVRFGNGVLAWFGAISLEFYLMHGLFVELFGYSFMDAAKSLVRIRSIPLYAAAVLACSAAAATGFRRLCRSVYGLLAGQRKKERPQAEQIPDDLPEAVRRIMKKNAASSGFAKLMKIVRKWFFPGLFLLMVIGFLLLSSKDPVRVVGGLRITPPTGYSQVFSDSRYIKWQYKGDEKKPGVLILDKEIKGDRAQQFSTVEAVMEECSSWMTDMEIYVNPQGVRMVRGFSTEFSEYPDRRYYVENDSAVFLLTMIEDSRYYDPADCEAVMQETADNIRRQ